MNHAAVVCMNSTTIFGVVLEACFWVGQHFEGLTTGEDNQYKHVF